jgi:hypothetical protein
MYNYIKVSSLSFQRYKCNLNVLKKKFTETPKNNSKIHIKELKDSNKKFPYEKEEESAQEKYKDFIVKNLKEEEAFRRSKDEEFFNQMKKNQLSPTKLSSLLMRRNFLKFKEEKSVPEPEVEIDLKDIENLKIEDPITLYEIDLNSINLYKKLDPLIRNYTIFAILFNGGFALSYKMLFMQTTLTYLGAYLSNILIFVSILYVNKLKNSKILSIEYLPRDKSIIITKWKNFSKNTQKIKFAAEELELYESDKFLEYGLNLRMKKNKKNNLYIGTDEEGIWHNRKIFDEIFLKKTY